MIGLAVLAVVAIYVAVCWFAITKARNRGEKVFALLIALLIPLWDLPIGYFSYRNLCSSEGGIHIYKRFPPQDKVFLDSLPSFSVNQMLRQGWKTVEVIRMDGKGIARHELGPNKEVITQEVQQPISNITVSIVRGQTLPWNIVREDRYARTRGDNETVARYSSFSWQGGWVYRLLSPVLGPGVSCSIGPEDPVVALLLRGA